MSMKMIVSTGSAPTDMTYIRDADGRIKELWPHEVSALLMDIAAKKSDVFVNIELLKPPKPKRVPLGKTMSEVKVSRRKGSGPLIFVDVELHDKGYYVAEVAMNANNPVFEAVVYVRQPRLENEDEGPAFGTTISYCFTGSDLYGVDRLAYCRLVKKIPGIGYPFKEEQHRQKNWSPVEDDPF